MGYQPANCVSTEVTEIESDWHPQLILDVFIMSNSGPWVWKELAVISRGEHSVIYSFYPSDCDLCLELFIHHRDQTKPCSKATELSGG